MGIFTLPWSSAGPTGKRNSIDKALNHIWIQALNQEPARELLCLFGFFHLLILFISGTMARNGLACLNANPGGLGATEWEEFVELHLSHLALTPGGKQ